MNIRFDDKVAVITGSSGGIGKVIAGELYNSGANIVITGRDSEKLASVKQNLEQQSEQSGEILTVVTDLSVPDAPKKLIDSALNKFGKIDVLVNNAGVFERGLIIQTDQEKLDRIFSINFTTAYMLSKHVLSHMKRNRYGRIINITSVSGQFGDKGISAYSASKSALTAFTKSITEEYGPYNITANCVAPGVIKTPMMTKATTKYLDDAQTRIPCRRFGNPEEVAALVAFLASERASYINGQEIAVNGGLYR